jgi:cytochrome c oxidase subunit 2
MSLSFSSIPDAVHTTFNLILVVSVILLVGITGMMVFFVVRYRRSKNPVPSQVESHTVLEVVWTLVPTLLVMGMFYFGFVGYHMMRNPPKDAMEVHATAQMWSWSFQYDNGKRSPELYVPQGKPIKVTLESRDVLHSFYLPAYMVKQDVVPGMKGFLWFQPDSLGTFDIFCAEYCGTRHSYMRSKVQVVPPDSFQTWVAEGVEAIPAAAEGEGSEEENQARLQRIGERLTKDRGCVACHTIDGTPLVGPTYKGLFGRTETVTTDGKTRQIVVDEDYIRRSILDPTADIVEGFQPLMPSQKGLMSDDEINAVIAYLKTL